MKFCDLNREYQAIKTEIDAAINAVFEHGQYINGPEVKEFEEKMAEYHGIKYALALNSGTDALLLSSMALNLKPGDEFITVPFTMAATTQGAMHCGAKPVFVDIDINTFNIDPDKIEEKINEKTKAIFTVHLFGQPAQMEKIRGLADKYNLAVVEDAAQAMGARFNNKPIGNFGDTVCHSFFPVKNLGCCGDGGMVLTDNKKIFEKIKLLKSHGAKEKYFHTELGINSRLDTIQAAVLLVKLKYIDESNKKRRGLAQKYNQALAGVGDLILPLENTGAYHVYHQYVIRAKKRDELKEYLANHNVPTMIYYPTPHHLQPLFSFLGHKENDFSMAEKACKEVLALPVYPWLKESEQEIIINKIKEFFS